MQLCQNGQRERLVNNKLSCSQSLQCLQLCTHLAITLCTCSVLSPQQLHVRALVPSKKPASLSETSSPSPERELSAEDTCLCLPCFCITEPPIPAWSFLHPYLTSRLRAGPQSPLSYCHVKPRKVCFPRTSNGGGTASLWTGAETPAANSQRPPGQSSPF